MLQEHWQGDVLRKRVTPTYFDKEKTRDIGTALLFDRRIMCRQSCEPSYEDSTTTQLGCCALDERPRALEEGMPTEFGP